MNYIIVDERISIGATVVSGKESLIDLDKRDATIEDTKIITEKLKDIDDSLLVVVIFSALEKMMRDAAHSYYQDPKQLNIESLGVAIKHLRAFGCLDAEFEERCHALKLLRNVFACSANSLSLDHPAIAARCLEIHKGLTELCAENLRKSPWFHDAFGVEETKNDIKILGFNISDKYNNIIMTIEDGQETNTSIRDILISSASCFFLVAASLKNGAVAVR